jgi:hypothetical protein
VEIVRRTRSTRFKAQKRMESIVVVYSQYNISAPSPGQDDVGGGGMGISPRQRRVCGKSPYNTSNVFKGLYDSEKGVKRVRNMLGNENKRTILWK